MFSQKLEANRSQKSNMNNVVCQLLQWPLIASMDEQISSENETKNEQCLYMLRQDKYIPKTPKNNNNSTEMTTNRRTQSSHEHKQENCLNLFDWFSECCTHNLNGCTKPFKSNHKNSHNSSSSDTSNYDDCRNLTSKNQQIRISQSSNNQKSALMQSKSYDFTISCFKNNCKNKNESSLNVNVNEKWKRWSVPIILSQTSIMFLIVLSVIVFGTRIAGAVTKDGLCQSKDIRNQASELMSLQGCRVIEGFLMITLIDRYEDTDFDNLTFPDLVEISEFLLLYRVSGLKSLELLFPNLRVIRGNSLVTNYALIIYEMFQLTEIGLKSLTTIVRGGVRIEKNPSLCFVDTINWQYIANGTQSDDHFIASNKNSNLCPVCPTGKKNELEVGDDISDIDCPKAEHDSTKRYCWNRSTCQKICPASCGRQACDDKGNCCDDSCLGSCSSTDPTICHVCRHKSVGPFNHRQCVEKCPDNLYEFDNYRCISDKDCWNISKPFALKVNTMKNPFIPFNGTCSLNCPSHHAADGKDGGRFCRPCLGECKKECLGGQIDSISTMQNFKGCTIITGNLLIQIRQGGNNVVKELEGSLSEVESIHGGLRILRSFPLVSLNFFKKLKEIRGQELEDSFSVYVMDNPNLQSLFDHDVVVHAGKLFFHFNPKLCYSIIERFSKNVTSLKNVEKIPIEEVAFSSNGDKIACNIVTLNVRISNLMYLGAIIDVEPMNYEDKRVLLAYVVHFKQAPFQNVTLYDGRNACGGDGWRVEDLVMFDKSNSFIQIVLTNLKAYTQYAFYVKTYTIASEPTGGRSEIQYFTTKPSKPGRIQKLKLLTTSSSSIVVTWDPPKLANGKLTNYIIKATLIYDNVKLLEQRNYCTEPLGKQDERPSQTPVVKEAKEPTGECDCPDTEVNYNEQKVLPEEDDVEQIIEFENVIQNIVFAKRTIVVTGEEPKTRRRRFIEAAAKYSNQTNNLGDQSPDIIFPTSEKEIEVNKTDDFTESIMVEGFYEKFYDNQTKHTNATSYTFKLEKLRHFSEYSISVQACRNFDDKSFYVETHCSELVVLSTKTAKIDSADDIQELTYKKVSNSSNGLSTIKLAWTEPANPNGLTVAYTIISKRVDVDSHLKPLEQCITQHAYANMSHEFPLLQLQNGNYSVQVKATSLAGDGNLSPEIFILIDESRVNATTILLSILGTVLLVILLVYGIWFFMRRKFGAHVSDLKLIASVNPEYVGMQYQVDEWEVSRDNVIQLRELGQGSFGMVYEGLVKIKDGENVPCAIKTVNENATDRERINFLKEAGVMKAFDTHHVVRLLGVVSATQPTLVIMELMVNGDLKGYLRSHRPDADSSIQPIAQPPSLKRILQMALEIADGMAYLSAKKFVHRDLAARNCMVADDLTVKIGDFGMTRDIYETDYYRKGTKGLLPVRWMAPESLKDGVFTSSSDVFSYGIVLWEIATGASQPYQGLSNDQVLRYVIDGGVMERPENCPDKLYRLMCRTWQHRPSSRPTFLQIVSMLLDDAAPNFRKVSFYHKQEAQELLQHAQHRTMVIDVTTPLKAEEDDFSLDDLAPDAFLMSDVHARSDSKVDGSASHSPLRSSLGLRRLTGLLDVASSKSNKNSPIAAVIPSSENSSLPHSILGYSGGHLNRGMNFLRNAFFYKNGGNNADIESPDYRKLQTNIYSTDPIAKVDDNSMTMVDIEYNDGSTKQQNLSNGIVVSGKSG